MQSSLCFLAPEFVYRKYVGLDITDLNFRENSIRIIRKGGNESVLYFGGEVEQALLAYIEGPRISIAGQAALEDENALFFSLQKKRISVHADVGTTRKHYAAIKDQNRRKSASAIKLREKE